LIVVWGASCSPGGVQPPSRETAVEPAAIEATAPQAQSDESSADGQPSEAAEPTPATAEEIAEICGVYRDALRSHWDDQRTREAVRGLALRSDMAAAWQTDLTDGDADQALAASRSVVEAAAQQDLATTCEALSGLVAVAGSMSEVPTQE